VPPGTRPILAAASLGIVVAAFGAHSSADAERRALASAEAEARALLRSVAAGIESNLQASRAVVRLAGDHLADLVPEVDARLSVAPERADDVLAEFVAARGLRGAVWLGDDLAVRAVAAPPRRADGRTSPDAPSVSSIARIEAEALARRAAEAGLPSSPRADLGLRDSPFGARTEVAVALRAEASGGFLLLRSDAASLERFREAAGIERLLAAAGSSEGIAYLALADASGRVAAAHPTSLVGTLLPPALREPAWREDASGERVLDVTASGAEAEDAIDSSAGRLHVRVGLVAAPVEHVIDGTRRGAAVATALLLVLGPGAILLLASRTRRAAAREEALRREIEERERFAALGRLAAAVAHEVRSPLNALSMATQRLAREARPEEPGTQRRFDEFVAAQGRAVERIDRTVEEFVGLARADGPLETAPADVGEILADVIAAEEAAVERRAPGGPVVVACDRALLSRALANLVRNAVQCAPPGTVALAWRREGADVVVEVDDGGPGIPPEEREAVFAPFRTQRPGGLGLGLTIARDALRRHGGDVTVTDSPSGGARFVVRIPAGGARP